MLTKNSPNSPKFICDVCDIKTNNKKDYNTHLLTAKHKKLTIVNNELTSLPQKDMNITFTCDKCTKKYKSRVGLWKHKKTCNYIDNPNIDSNNEEPNELNNMKSVNEVDTSTK